MFRTLFRGLRGCTTVPFCPLKVPPNPPLHRQAQSSVSAFSFSYTKVVFHFYLVFGL